MRPTTRKDPTFEDGQRVQLKDDRNKHINTWIVLSTNESGTVRIHRAGRPQTIYTTMNVQPTHLQEETTP